MAKLLFSLLVVAVSLESEAAVIVKFKSNLSKSAATEFNKSFTQQPLIQELGVVLVESKNKRVDALSVLKNLDFIEYVQEDRPIRIRERRPNDAQFGDQWHMPKISAPAAWDVSTGGANSLGHQPVVAVVDEGMDIDHEDLKENIWVNPAEIVGNGIDDDHNGYVDDINGWNTVNDNGIVKSLTAWEMHSTHVAGIIGAKGNNSRNVAGVNWNIKIMALKALKEDGGSLTSRALKAYGYVLKQKKLWLESKGAKGVNIVATNSSFGEDFANCNSGEYPAWNDIYNEMGKAGILSAAATANNNINVDTQGDVPTGCNSSYLVTVTNTTRTDALSTIAAYGKENVDLGAPGTNVLSTLPGNQTGEETGTSMSTPVVTGAIALLHTVASPKLAKLDLENPPQAAAIYKNILLTTVDKVPDLGGRTVSGGRINLAKAVAAAAAYGN